MAESTKQKLKQFWELLKAPEKDLLKLVNQLSDDFYQMSRSVPRKGDLEAALRNQFGAIVEKAFSNYFKLNTIQVFWSLTDKDLEPFDIQSENFDSSQKESQENLNTFDKSFADEQTKRKREALNKILFDLNVEYNSMDFFRSMVEFDFSPSHIFTIEPDLMPGVENTEAVSIGMYDPLTEDCPMVISRSRRITVPLPGISQFVEELGRDGDDGDLRGKIVSRIEEWTPELEENFFANDFWGGTNKWIHWGNINCMPPRLIQSGKKAQDAIRRRFHDARKHIALIAIYAAVNRRPAASLALSSLTHGRISPSMIIYWCAPENLIRTGERIREKVECFRQFVVLASAQIQPILGHNVAVILGNQEAKMERNRGLGLLGHSLGHRVKAFAQHCLEDPVAARNKQIMLEDTLDAIQLLTVESREELFCHDKRCRWLRYANDGKGIDLIDLVGVLNQCEELVIAEREGDPWGKNENILCLIRPKLLFQPSPPNPVYLGFFRDVEGKSCQLQEFVFRDLFSEILMNCLTYGIPRLQNTSPQDSAVERKTVDCHVNCGVFVTSDSLTIRNEIKEESTKYLSQKGFKVEENKKFCTLPKGREFDGPKLSASILENFDFAVLLYRIWMRAEGNSFFETRLQLLRNEGENHDELHGCR